MGALMGHVDNLQDEQARLFDVAINIEDNEAASEYVNTAAHRIDEVKELIENAIRKIKESQNERS